MFAAPVESALEWKESGVKGIYRFLNKLWKLIFNYVDIQNTHKKMNFNFLNYEQNVLRYKLHKTIHKVSDDISRRKTFNTAISAIMELVNQLAKAPIQEEQDKSIMRESLICIIKMLYPFTPHFCFFVWNYFYRNVSIDNEKWPVFKEDILLKKYNVIIIQINGKTRCTINMPNNSTKEEVLLAAKNKNIIKKYLQDVNIRKIIYIPNKIINFVI